MNLDLTKYGKVPPHAIDLEEAVLGALMIDVNCVFVAMGRLFPSIFYLESHQNVFKAIQGLYDKNMKIDIFTVTEALKTAKNIESVGGAYGVTKLTNSVISGANIENHINILSEMYLKREAIRLSGELITDSFDESTDAFDVINKADSGLQKIQESVIKGAIKDVSYYGMQVLDQHSVVKSSGVLGISTGLKSLDKVISGLVSPDLIILAARPGQGKTALALSITHNTSVIGDVPCAWFSLEMDGTQLVRRLASIESKIDHEKIRKGYTTKEEDILLGDAISKISNAPIFIEDRASISVRDIRTRGNILKKKHGIKYIVVDYLQLMKSAEFVKGRNREQEISEISRTLKVIAKELEIPVVALSQLSRAVEARSDKMPQLSDLRESGAIEQDADEVMFLMRPEYYNMMNEVEIGGKSYDPMGLAIGSIAKNRHGSTKNIAMYFKGATMHFLDHPNDEINTMGGSWQPLSKEDVETTDILF